MSEYNEQTYVSRHQSEIPILPWTCGESEAESAADESAADKSAPPGQLQAAAAAQRQPAESDPRCLCELHIILLFLLEHLVIKPGCVEYLENSIYPVTDAGLQ